MKDWTYIEPDHAIAARLRIVVESLKSSKGRMENRLIDIFLNIDELKETDFPEELRGSLTEIKARLRNHPSGEQASAVAKQIVRLYDKITRDYCLPTILKSE